jgi:hypothetical protein
MRGFPCKTEAVSLYLSGQDETADAEAIASVRGGDSAGNPSPFPDRHFVRVLSSDTPFMATLCITPEARADSLLIGLAEALGEVFFASIGIVALEFTVDDTPIEAK